MKESAWHWIVHRFRLICSFPTMLGTVIVGLVFATTRRGLADPDIWWHLRNAGEFLSTGKWARTDLYSFTVAGHPWVNYEWLAELPYYFAWKWFGLAGIKTLSLALLESIFIGLLILCWRKSRNIKASAAACSLSVFLGTVSFGPRTILFGYACLLILLVILEEFRSRGSGPLWALPLLFCVWANLHGSWFLGMMVFGIYALLGDAEGRWLSMDARRWSPSELTSLVTAMGASILGVFVNPYGYRLVFYPFDMAFRQRLNIANVTEWFSVDFHDARGKVALVFLVVLLAGAALKAQRWKLCDLALVLFGLCVGLTYVRFLFLAGILAAPVIADLLNFLPAYDRAIDKPILNALMIAGSVAFIFLKFPTNLQLRESVEREYPADVVPYLEAHRLSGPVLNYYLWGGYLGWQDPQFKDFIDSRVDIFEYAGVLKDYLALRDPNDALPVLDKYAICYVLFPPREPLSYLLKRDPDWQVIFRGDVSMLFARASNGCGMPVASR